MPYYCQRTETMFFSLLMEKMEMHQGGATFGKQPRRSSGGRFKNTGGRDTEKKNHQHEQVQIYPEDNGSNWVPFYL